MLRADQPATWLLNSCQPWVVKLLSDSPVRRAGFSRLDDVDAGFVLNNCGGFVAPGRLRLVGMWRSWDRSTHGRESLYPPVWGLSSLRPGIIRFQVNIENLGEGCLRPWPAK
jgi:hypothetical protein